MSNRVPFDKKGFEFFIGYEDGDKVGYKNGDEVGYRDGDQVRPLYVMRPKISAYRRDFDKTKYLFF